VIYVQFHNVPDDTENCIQIFLNGDDRLGEHEVGKWNMVQGKPKALR